MQLNVISNTLCLSAESVIARKPFFVPCISKYNLSDINFF